MKPKHKLSAIKLQCPLCCEDAFSSYESLYEHLLSITENLFCTACNTRFDDVAKLIQHIGNRCQEPEPEPEPEPSPNVLAVERNVVIDPANQSLLDLLEGNDTQDCEVDTAVPITAKTEPPIVPDEYEEEEEIVEEELFHCSECNVNFVDIDDHLKQFHQGQKVLLEDGNQSTERTISPPPLILLPSKNVNTPSNVLTTTNVTNGPKRTKEYVIRNGKPVPLEEDDTEVSDTNDLIVMHQCSVCRVHFISQEEFNVHVCRLQPNFTFNPETSLLEEGDITKTNDARKMRGKGRTTLRDDFKPIPVLPKHDIHCTECTSVFTNEKELKLHLKVHRELDKMQMEKEGPHICKHCNTEFASIKSLRLHGRMHDPVKQKEIEPPVNYGITGEINYAIATTKRNTFSCEVCGNDYDDEYREVHMRSHAEAAAGENNLHHCDVCNKRFSSQQFLDMHMAAHMDAKRFVCTYCKKAFLTIALLNAHTSEECHVRPYECRFCGRRFARPHEKVKHERIHTGEKPHVCGVCGKAFRVGYCLTLHMRTHSGSRPYQCPHCLKRFKAHSVYTHHLHTHSNERKYKCPFCPKAFKTSVQLAGHKNCHTKPFNCNVCNRPFASLYAVKLHMDTHKKANNLNHNCQYCGASYARAFALRDHIRELHAEEDAANPESQDPFIMINPDLNAEDSSSVNNNNDDDGQQEPTGNEMEIEMCEAVVEEADEELVDEEEEEEEEVEELVEEIDMEEANEEELTYLNDIHEEVEAEEESNDKMIVPDVTHIMIRNDTAVGLEVEGEEVLCS